MPVEPVPLLGPVQVYKRLLGYAQVHALSPRPFSPHFPEIKVMFKADSVGQPLGLYLIEPNDMWRLFLRPGYRRIPTGEIFRPTRLALSRVPTDPENPYGPDLELNGDYVDMDAFAGDLFSTFSGARYG